MPPLWNTAVATTGRPACAPSTAAATTPPSCSTLTETTSKPSSTRRRRSRIRPEVLPATRAWCGRRVAARSRDNASTRPTRGDGLGTREARLLLLPCPLNGVGRHRGADELLEGGFVDLLPFVEVDRAPRAPFQAGIEELLRVFEGGAAGEGELHDRFVRFPCADDAVMRPDGDSR